MHETRTAPFIILDLIMLMVRKHQIGQDKTGQGRTRQVHPELLKTVQHISMTVEHVRNSSSGNKNAVAY